MTTVAPQKPRVLYFIVNYPTFSETYMHEEIRSFRDRYEIRIITYNASQFPRRQPFPYDVIRYQDPCLVYGAIEKIDRGFTGPAQAEFLRQVDAVVAEFKPDILHGHYLGLSLLLRNLAERHRVPFTLRTHSMDVLSEPRPKLEAFRDATDTAWCLRVLAFPASGERLAEHGFSSKKVVPCWPVVNFARFYRPDRRAPTGQVMCAGPVIRKKAHHEFVQLAAMMRGSGLTFDLYGAGPALGRTRALNEELGNPARITYADPDDMPEVYPRYDWLVYPSDQKINKVGLPVAIAEAQASGIGVCWQELPGRREEQLAYLGGGGFLFRSIEEVPGLLSRPYPEEMRQKGLEAAKRCDIEGHKSLLTEVWDRAVAATAA